VNPPASELLVRGAALYLPIAIGIALVVWRRPSARQVAGAVVAFAWNFVGLIALNVIAVRAQWWTFTTDNATVAGVPADLWIGWALLWGALPSLSPSTDHQSVAIDHRRLFVTAALLIGGDLVLMPLAKPVLTLHPTWLLGEVPATATCLVPGLYLAEWTSRRVCLRTRATLQFVICSGLLLYVLPTLIFTMTGESWSHLLHRPRWHFLVAALVTSPASAMALQAVREFVVVGGGTPVPLDPPTRLVATGPYAYIANPMQLGATVILAAWGMLIGSLAVVAAAGMAALFSAGYAAWSEDADLTRRYGERWSDYRSHVRVWLPRWRPYIAEPATVFASATCEQCSQVGQFLSRRRSAGLTVGAAESAPTPLQRITYQANAVTDDGIAAIGRSLEHVNLVWAIASWIIRLPLILPTLQLITDAIGAGPRDITWHPTPAATSSPICRPAGPSGAVSAASHSFTDAQVPGKDDARSG
jgi:protein-S-isoprenylcysteine O-methyltransferase Ste14